MPSPSIWWNPSCLQLPYCQASCHSLQKFVYLPTAICFHISYAGERLVWDVFDRFAFAVNVSLSVSDDFAYKSYIVKSMVFV